MTPASLYRSSTFRLAALYVALFAVSFGILFAIIWWLTTGYVARQAEAAVDSEIASLTEHYERRGLPGLLSVVSERIAGDPTHRTLYLVADPLLRPLIGNLNAWPNVEPDEGGWMEVRIAGEPGKGGARTFRARSLVLAGALHFLVGRDLREAQDFRRQLVNALGWSAAVMLVLAVTGGALMSLSTGRRIDAINEATRQIMGGDLGRRIATRGSGDDFDALAENLNAMLDRIQALMDGVRQVSDGVAHDLRTPLTRLRSRLEQLDRQPGTAEDQRVLIEAAMAEADSLIATFNALLRIARIESRSQQAEFAPIDLVALAADVAELYEPLCEERGLTLARPTGEPVSVSADRDLLFQAVANLVDNAVKYTPRGGHLRLSVEADDAGARLAVTDDGPGIPEAFRGKVFDRFFRVDSGGGIPGSGLGLTLAAAIARLHGAEIVLEPREPGLAAVIAFPRAAVGAAPQPSTNAPAGVRC